ncbi:hypothetical protein MPNT_160056 [Candidatus Methylacidithermus pantelleriae]|uniref:Uncharacterized protein n=1 Tax=Candidatus Methylacidithermus pantelleriae TaxID=2744239 RepID=A0A8J2BRP0_9BACT|nr:hypothetical protein MPNT_160056 [Candidatus Methylacidithermus pantelleriae]
MRRESVSLVRIAGANAYNRSGRAVSHRMENPRSGKRPSLVRPVC